MSEREGEFVIYGTTGNGGEDATYIGNARSLRRLTFSLH
jgi:hypothetical protein